ncbi:hypothetical protein [Edaphobacter modestus]|uniref:helix-hairpin-helix domain-containing protein n=1 Tax=Edaphobacter modestus TaxID=388466 RepID=UPI001F5ED7C8|nr:hypothetical protein [Edaphobacter modestus]
MGFYSSAVLVKEAQRHGLRVKPIDVQTSDWPCTIEYESNGTLSLRLGLSYAKRLRKRSAEALVGSRALDGPPSARRRILPCASRRWTGKNSRSLPESER